jgi:tripartite-type tricarboxylate transporter receptor subunit TctC
MNFLKLRFGCALLLAAGFTLAAAEAAAQEYPVRPVRLIIPFSAGGAADVPGRIVAQRLSDGLRQQVIIENRPGAGTSIGVKAAAALPPDGYSLLMYGQNIAYLQMLYPDLGFDPVKAFVPIAPLAAYFHVIVISPALPVKTLPEFVA